MGIKKVVNRVFVALLTLIVLMFILVAVILVIRVSAKDMTQATTIRPAKVIGIATYRNCVNACGVNHGHYIEFANVAIQSGCLQDPNCSTCMDMCVDQLRINNPDMYKAILDHTNREE